MREPQIMKRWINSLLKFLQRFRSIPSSLKITSILLILGILVSGIKLGLAYADGSYTVSGQITINSNPLPGRDADADPGFTLFSTSGDGAVGSDGNVYGGNYSVSNLPDDSYNLGFSYYYNGNSGTSGVPSSFSLASTSPFVTVNGGNTTQNLSLDTDTLNVTVLDGNGNPVSGSFVKVNEVGNGVITDMAGNTYNASSVSSDGNTNSSGIVALSLFPGLTYSVCAWTSSGGEYCAQENVTVNSNTTSTVYLEPVPVPPTDLNIPSPTNAPDLTWTGVENADSYNIYSNNILIGSTTSTTYTDNNPVVGTDTYYVTAVNLAGESGPSNKVTVTVENIKPTITSPSSYVINARAMLNFTITTTGYPTPVISWSTTSGSLPPGLSFKDNGDGTATLSGQVPTQNQGYYFITFTASNSAGSTNQQFLLTTTDYNEPVTFLNVNNITETYNVPFSFTIDTTGVPVPTISKLAGSGSLPTGVTLVNNKDGTATLSGNLDNASDYGVFTFTIKASNSSGTVYQVFTITIDKGTTLKNIANQTASVGTTFSMGISTTGFPEPTFTASNLPNGLSIQNNGDSTATISGTPAVGSGGSYQVTVTAYNSFGTDAQTFTLKVDEGPSITSANTATATRGQAFSFQVTATGFPAPTYALTGTLPKGITFNSNTGLFSGTPKATDAPGTYQFTITATNSTGPATQNFTLILN